MALIISIVSFDESTPLGEVIREKLREHTGAEVAIKVTNYYQEQSEVKTLNQTDSEILDEPSSSTFHFTFQIPYKRPVSWKVKCQISKKRIIVTSVFGVLGRCPNYFHLATLVVLTHLGGKVSQEKISDYAYVKYEEWLKLNGGIPPRWKYNLVALVAISGVVIYVPMAIGTAAINVIKNFSKKT